MTSSIAVPVEIESVFQEADDPLLPLDEFELSSKFAQARKKLTVEIGQQSAAFADVVAWHFGRFENRDGEAWGLYWGPRATWKIDDSTLKHTPDLAEIDDAILTLWGHRADTAKNPAIAARYADLAWTIGGYLSRPLASRPECNAPRSSLKAPYKLGLSAVDHYLAAVNRDLVKNELQAWSYLFRAVDLAVSMNNAERIQRAKDALFAYYAKRSAAGRFLWWQIDQITAQFATGLDLSSEETETIMRGLRKVLDDSADASRDTFDPHAAEAVADRIIQRVSNKDLSTIQLLVKQAGVAFEIAAADANGMLATSWLEDLALRYHEYGLTDDAVRMEQAVQARAADAKAEMKPFYVRLDISEEEVSAWAEHVAGISLDDGLLRIAHSGLALEQSVEQMVKESMVQAPLMARISRVHIGEDGFTEAEIGSIENDLLGRVIQQAAQLLNVQAPLLHVFFERLKEKHELNLDGLVQYLRQSPFFQENREKRLRRGLSAWLDGDAETAIHVLVPQVEAACRSLVETAGISVRTPNHDSVGGVGVIGLGALLGKSIFKDGGIKDVGFHLRALYTDQRGINLRNKICHGLAGDSLLGTETADLVVHSMLMLASIGFTQSTGDAVEVSQEQRAVGS